MTTLIRTGAFVGPLASMISTPFELVKTQQMLARKAHFHSPQIQNSSIACAQHVMKNHGLMNGLYSGHAVNSFREVVFLSTYFTIYEHNKQAFQMIFPASVAVPIGLTNSLLLKTIS